MAKMRYARARRVHTPFRKAPEKEQLIWEQQSRGMNGPVKRLDPNTYKPQVDLSHPEVCTDKTRDRKTSG